MNEIIIKNWNEEVSSEDEVYILGDVAMGLIEKAPPLIRRMNGRKYLVKGNHDKTLTKKREDGTRLSDDLFEWVWSDRVYDMYYKVDGGKVPVVMCHYPISHWEHMNQGSLMLHGHLHGNPSGLSGRIFDVGIDTNNLRPYRMDDVVRKLLAVTVIRDHHGD
jgi:calcineurin-like phosphoesterase family protein